MGAYLKIGDTDVSRFITENNYSCITEPVYDDDSAFTNIYGERLRPRTGCSVKLTATLYDVDDDTAASLENALRGERVTAEYSAPDEKTAEFECTKFALSLDRIYRGERFWTVDIALTAGFVADDGL